MIQIMFIRLLLTKFQNLDKTAVTTYKINYIHIFLLMFYQKYIRLMTLLTTSISSY